MFAAAAARAARPLACAGLLPAAYLTRRDQDARCLERRLADAYHLLEPERPLGVGGHGVVFPGVNKSSGEIMAIKQVSKKHLPPEALKRLGKTPMAWLPNMHGGRSTKSKSD